MGGGAEAVQMSGTSMASPHMTGVMALLKQAHPGLTSAELKSLAMGSAKTMVDADKKVYPLSRQGAGRIQVIQALDQTVISTPVAVSLGEVTIEARKLLRKQLTVKNISAAAQSFDIAFAGDAAISMRGPTSLALAAGEAQTLTFDFVIDAGLLPQTSTEIDGLLKLNVAGKEALRIPVIAIADKIAQVQVDSLVVHSTSIVDSQGAAVDLTLKNVGTNDGDAFLFNLIGEGARKEDKYHDPFVERGCDLQQAGYRIVEKNGARVLQFAIKIYEPLSTWDNCEISISIDSDRDGVADQELVGIKQDHLKGLSKPQFASVLLDATKARALRKQFELDTQAKKKNVTENYTDAVLSLSDMFSPVFSTVAIVEAPIEALALRPSGELAVRIATSYQELSTVEPDDYLIKDPTVWSPISITDSGQAFSGMPEKVSLKAGTTQTVSLTKGAGAEKLLVLAPENAPVIGGLRHDQQSFVLDPVYDVSLLAGH